MKNSPLIIACCVVILGTVGIGWLHGHATNRWGMHVSLEAAAAELARPMPTQVGRWRLRQELEMSADAIELLHCPAYINRIYDHEETGDVISVFVIVGPAGPIAVHTPEICYSSRDYNISATRKRLLLANPQIGQHSFWDLKLTPNDERNVPLRVVYGWAPVKSWEAQEYPRYRYGYAPYLYKLQAALVTSARERPANYDPCQDFLQGFVAQLDSHLLDPAAPATAGR